jgi:hypothetical protein
MIDVMSDEAFERVKLILHGVPGGAEKALTSIITRARGTVRAAALEGITSVYDIKQKDVRDRKNTTVNMRTRKADGGIVGEVSFSGGKIPLYRFGVTPKKPTPRENQHVSVRQLKSSPLTRLDNAFVAEMTNPGGRGHLGIFERKPGNYMKKRINKSGRSKHAERIGAIKGNADQFYGASTPQMAENSVVLEKVEAAAVDTVVKRTEHEISRILHGYGGR